VSCIASVASATDRAAETGVKLGQLPLAASVLSTTNSSESKRSESAKSCEMIAPVRALTKWPPMTLRGWESGASGTA